MSLISTEFNYNGVSYAFDMRDADDAEKFENAIHDLENDEKAIPKDGKASDIIRNHCVILKKFFDTCFEEGAGTKICTEKNNIALCYEAYEAFLNFVALQKDDIVKHKNVFSQYSNRQQRRAARKDSK